MTNPTIKTEQMTMAPPAPGYPFQKFMSGPAGPATEFELHVRGPVTSKELYRIANTIMQAQGWMTADETDQVGETTRMSK